MKEYQFSDNDTKLIFLIGFDSKFMNNMSMNLEYQSFLGSTKSKEITNSEISFIDALKILNFLKSSGEARRLIRGNGAKINDVIINNENYTLSNKDYQNGKVKISYGKKKHGLLILS